MRYFLPVKNMKSLRRPATAAVSAAAVAVPFVAEAQQQPAGQTVSQGLVPNSWLFDASGNLIWLSEEDLKQYELAQLVTPEGAVQVDEAGSQVLGISTALLNQIGWYSVGAGAAAGAAAALASGLGGSGAEVAPAVNSSSNLAASVSILDDLREAYDREFEFIFEDPNGIDRQHLEERLKDTFEVTVTSTFSGTPPKPPEPDLIISTTVNEADLIAGAVSAYSKVTAEVDWYLGGSDTKELFYKDADGFVELLFLPVTVTANTAPTVWVVDKVIQRSAPDQTIQYVVVDPEGIDVSDFKEAIEYGLNGASTIASVFATSPYPVVTVTPNPLDRAPYSGTDDTFGAVTLTISGSGATNVNIGEWAVGSYYWDALGNLETLPLEVTIT